MHSLLSIVVPPVFSPSHAHLLTVSGAAEACLWEVPAGRLAAPPLCPAAPINSALFSPDGQAVVLACENDTAQVWSVATGQRRWTLPHPQPVRAAEFSPDHRHIVTTGDDGLVRWWDAATGQPVERGLAIPRYGSSVRTARHSPDGRRLVLVTGALTVICDLTATNAPPITLGQGWWVYDAAFSPDSTKLLTWSREAAARLWDARTGALLLPPLKHRQAVSRAWFTLDGLRILTVSLDNVAQLWDARTGELLAPPFSQESITPGLMRNHVSPDGRRLATRQEGRSRLWDLAGSALAGPCLRIPGARQVQFTRDGRWLLVLDDAKVVQVWDPFGGQEVLATLTNLAAELPVPLLANLGPLVTSISPPNTNLPPAVLSPDGRVELTIHANSATLRSAHNPGELAPPLTHAEKITWAVFSPDGRRVATASFDGTVRVWDTRSGAPLAPPLPHVFWAQHAAFSPDGNLLATVSAQEDRVCVWDLRPDQRPLPDLVSLCLLLLDAEWRGNNLVHQADPEPVCRAWSALRAKYPASFELNPWQQDNWHAHQALLTLRQGGPGEVPFLPLAPPGAGELSLRLARLRLWVHQYAPAQAELTAALARRPESADAWHLRGHCLFKSQRFSNAVEDFSRALELEPRRPSTWYSRGLCWRALQKPQAAAHDFGRAIALQPGSPGYWEARAQALVELNRWAEAFADYAQARELTAGIRPAAAPRARPWQSPALARDPRAARRQLDLEPHYNLTLSPLAPHAGWASLDLTQVPSGLVSFDGTAFDVRGIVHLASLDTVHRAAHFPASALGIPIRQTARALHFLHAASLGTVSGERMASYWVHYADGGAIEVPVIYSRNTYDFAKPPPAPLPEASLVFSVNHPKWTQCVYHFVWRNPRPETELMALDFVSANSDGAPFLLAITVEP